MDKFPVYKLQQPSHALHSCVEPRVQVAAAVTRPPQLCGATCTSCSSRRTPCTAMWSHVYKLQQPSHALNSYVEPRVQVAADVTRPPQLCRAPCTSCSSRHTPSTAMWSPVYKLQHSSHALHICVESRVQVAAPVTRPPQLCEAPCNIRVL